MYRKGGTACPKERFCRVEFWRCCWGAAGVWALLFGRGSFPAFNGYYQLDDYLQEFEQSLAQNLPFADQLSSLAVKLQMIGGAKGV